MNQRNSDEVRGVVREQYGAIARGDTACTPGCCGTGTDGTKLGYSPAELASLPEGADLGLGCGNPQAIAALRPGETVLDLGSGAGFDCFLAAQQVGPSGRVIGVDMTAAMIEKARANASKIAAANVEFRLGEIEHLPIPDASVDVILSNCVVNLSPDKASVFREAFRALRPGGRLAISDVLQTTPVPAALANDLAAYCGCVAGAATVADVKAYLEAAGFQDVRVVVREESRAFIRDWIPGSRAEDYVASATIEATKPTAKSCCAPSCCAPGARA